MANKTIKFIITLEGKEIEKFAFPIGEKAKVIIGKNPNISDVIINQSYISGKHLEIYKNEYDEIFLTDLNSTNGVFINNKKIIPNKKTRVNVGDIVSFMNGSLIQLLILNPAVQTPISEKPKKDFSHTIIGIAEEKSKITLGRSPDCDIILDTDFASSCHLIIEKNNDNTFSITDNNSTNGTYINERFLTGTVKINTDDKIRIGEYVFKLSDYLGASNKLKTVSTTDKDSELKKLLQKKSVVIIGRSKKSDIILNDNLVSRSHAKITKDADKYFIEDLKSSNGTFLNGKRIYKKINFSENDEIRIGLKVFKLGKNIKELSNYTAIRAVNITKIYPNNYVGLKPTSLNIPARSFIALMGPSGCGKTTLMNMLNGANPATKGSVYIHGLELTQNIDILKQKIGYVPQDDIVHKELTVNKSLYYAAKLRMNKDTTEEEIIQRINEVCTSLNINDKIIRENKVKDLSGGQRKRVSIAVELLNKPTILFLDEPTSPLDPETIDGFLSSIRDLTVKENTTVVMVTHKPEDLHYTDRVVFLAKKGYPAFYGNENELYNYFNLKEKDIIGVYSELSKETNIKKWYEKWKKNNPAVNVKENPKTIQKNHKDSLLRQFLWLTKRYASIKVNDKANVAILMLQPLLIPLALIYIFSELQLGVLFMMAVSAVWFGVSNAAKEIVGEIPIYERERMFNLNIFTYVFSKIAVLSVIAIIQISIFVLILKLKFSGGDVFLVNTSKVIIFMFYLTFSATLLGLLLSVIFKNSEQVMSVLPIILIPQIIFSGVIADINTTDKEILSYAMLGRWGTEGLARIQNDYDGFKEYKYSDKDSLIITDKFKKDKIFQIKIPVELTGPQSAKIEEKEIYHRDTVSIKSVCGYAEKINCDYEIKSVKAIVPKTYTSTDTLLYKNTEYSEDKKAVPYTWQEGNKYITSNPLKSLGFYENNKLINAFDSFNKNILIISLINILVFIMICIFLKKKDKI